MIAPISPCKDCDDRKISCHSSCKKYQEFKVANEKYQAELRAAKSVDYMVTDYNIKMNIRKRKRIRECK